MDFVRTMVKRSKRRSKYAFIAVLSVSIVYFIAVANFLGLNHEEKNIEALLHDSTYGEQTMQLSTNFTACLTQPLKHIQWFLKQSLLLDAITKLKRKTVVSTGFLRTNLFNFRYDRDEKIHSDHSSAVQEFLLLVMSEDVKVSLIEPSVLFCMLPTVQEDLLLRKGFNLSEHFGAENIVTFAMTNKYASKLQNESVDSDLKSAGFRHWTLYSNNPGIDEKSSLIPTHHIYVRDDQVVHVVVFYQRSEYFWHGDMTEIPDEVLRIINAEDLLFGSYAAAFEKFTEVPVNLTEISFHFYIPSNLQHFLFQIPTSRFLECNSSAAPPTNVTLSAAELHMGRMSSDKFRTRTLVALQQLKKRLHPLLISFWIACGSLLGWYRECGLLEHTHDVDFAAWATDVSDDLVEVFKKKSHLYVERIMGLPENGLEYRLNCYGLNIDIFFIYDDGEDFWCGIHRPSSGYLYRLMYPRFTLCSAELLGHKVQVPCEPESVIKAEYGPDWRSPVINWDYEKSPFNRGLKYYWTEKERPRSYIEY